MTENEEFEQESNEKASRMKTSWDDQIFQDAMQARTGPEIISVILDANPSKEASGSAPQPVQRRAPPTTATADNTAGRTPSENWPEYPAHYQGHS